MSNDSWKRWANTGPNSVASSFRTLRWSWSGPKALEGFKPSRSLVTPSLETTILSMKGADLSRSGTWVCSFSLSTSINWPLNSSAFSRSDCTTPFPFILFRGGIPWVSFFWLLMYRQKPLGLALTSPTKLLTYKSCCFQTSALISLLKVSVFDQSLLLHVYFAFAWVLFFSANLPSNRRGYPWDWGDRATRFWWNVFICWTLNKRCNQFEIFLYWSSIRMTIEIFIQMHPSP